MRSDGRGAGGLAHDGGNEENFSSGGQQEAAALVSLAGRQVAAWLPQSSLEMQRDSARHGEPKLNAEHEEQAPGENGQATGLVKVTRHGKRTPLHSRRMEAS
jgi:hypothetical protein